MSIGQTLFLFTGMSRWKGWILRDGEAEGTVPLPAVAGGGNITEFKIVPGKPVL